LAGCALADYDRGETTGNANLDGLRLEILDATKQGVSVTAQQVEHRLKFFDTLSADWGGNSAHPWNYKALFGVERTSVLHMLNNIRYCHNLSK